MLKVCIVIDETIIESHHGVRGYLFSLASVLSEVYIVEFVLSIGKLNCDLRYLKTYFNESFLLNNGFDENRLIGSNRNEILANLHKTLTNKTCDRKSNYFTTLLGDDLTSYDACIVGGPWVMKNLNNKLPQQLYCMAFDAIPNIYSLSNNDNLGLCTFANEHYEGYLRAISSYSGLLAISSETVKQVQQFIPTKKIIELPPLFPNGYFPSDRAKIKTTVDTVAILAAPFDQRKGFKILPEIINSSSISKLIIFGGVRCPIEEVEAFYNTLTLDSVEWWSSVTIKKQQQLYSAADILLFPSYNEGLGLPIIESLCFGVTPLVRNIKPVNQLVPSNYILDFDGDISTIKKAIDTIMSNKSIRHENIKQAEIIYSESKLTTQILRFS